MNETVRAFNAECAERIGPVESVVELGSYNVNGRVRDLWPMARYVGVDLRPGPDVDVVGDAASWQPETPVDLVICNSVLEHTPCGEAIISGAHTMLVEGGYLILTAPAKGYPAHDIDGKALPEEDYHDNPDVPTLLGWLRPFASMEMTQRAGMLCVLARKGVRIPREGEKAKTVMTSLGYTTCTRCHRVLFVEHGPTCPECLAAIAHERELQEQLALQNPAIESAGGRRKAHRHNEDDAA